MKKRLFFVPFFIFVCFCLAEDVWENEIVSPLGDNGVLRSVKYDESTATFYGCGTYIDWFDISPDVCENDLALVQYDRNGNILKNIQLQLTDTIHYDFTREDTGYDIIKTEDNGYIVVGGVQLHSENFRAVQAIYKFDADMNFEWVKEIDSEFDHNTCINKIYPVEGGYLLLTSEFSTEDPYGKEINEKEKAGTIRYVSKVDSDFNIVWEKRLDFESLGYCIVYNSTFSDITDNNEVFCQVFEDNKQAIIKINSQGELEKVFETIDTPFSYNLQNGLFYILKKSNESTINLEVYSSDFNIVTTIGTNFSKFGRLDIVKNEKLYVVVNCFQWGEEGHRLYLYTFDENYNLVMNKVYNKDLVSHIKPALVADDGYYFYSDIVPTKIYKFDSDGNSTLEEVGIAEESFNPETTALLGSYPNPFNPTTTIKFNLTEQNKVKLAVYDIGGREVAELVNGNINAGLHSKEFDATAFNSGIYFVRLLAGNKHIQTQKITLIK